MSETPLPEQGPVDVNVRGAEKHNEFLVFFSPTTGGFHVCCRIEREPHFSWPYVGVLKRGRVFTPDGAVKYARKYVEQRRHREPEFDFRIDFSGINESAHNTKLMDADRRSL